MESRNNRRIRRIALLSMLLPLTLASTAQTPLRWQSSPPAAATAAQPLAQVSVPAQTSLLPAPPRPVHQARSPAAAVESMPVETMPLATGFDVRLFEHMAQSLVAGQRVPGIAMAIVHDGRVLSARGYGITDIAAAEPVDAHTVFRLASLSKGFAGTMTGLLVSEGALRWDSKLSQFLPGLHLSSASATQQLTVADVLSQQTGLRGHSFDRAIEANADYRDLIAQLSTAPTACAPGQCYTYQNVAFSLIGDIVFATTGNFYGQAVEQRLFKPLGMHDASLGLDGIEASPSWARPHVRTRGGWASVHPKPTYYRLPPAAGINASASDMAQWLLAQGGHRPDVLPAPLLATLHQPLVDTPGQTRSSRWRRERLYSAGYGLGWRVYDYAGHRLVYHAGAVQGYRGMIALLPERDLGIVVLWNGESQLPSGLMPTILDRAIGLTTSQAWLDDDVLDEAMYAYANARSPMSPAAAPRKPAGSESDAATAAPQ